MKCSLKPGDVQFGLKFDLFSELLAGGEAVTRTQFVLFSVVVSRETERQNVFICWTSFVGKFCCSSADE